MGACLKRLDARSQFPSPVLIVPRRVQAQRTGVEPEGVTKASTSVQTSHIGKCGTVKRAMDITSRGGNQKPYEDDLSALGHPCMSKIDGSGDRKGSLKLFQWPAKNRRLGMPTLVFNVQLTSPGCQRFWFRDKLPKESLIRMKIKGQAALGNDTESLGLFYGLLLDFGIDTVSEPYKKYVLAKHNWYFAGSSDKDGRPEACRAHALNIEKGYYGGWAPEERTRPDRTKAHQAEVETIVELK
ncbi:hypothetical protein Tco_0813952 [Tanacetum coccineum]